MSIEDRLAAIEARLAALEQKNTAPEERARLKAFTQVLRGELLRAQAAPAPSRGPDPVQQA